MNSCLYDIKIMHDRHMPKRYKFEHRMFMFYLDLAELPQLGRMSWLLGYNQSRVYNFKESDHISQIDQYLEEKGVKHQVRDIKLLTNLRTFGHVFNPVSFYFCFDGNQKPVCVVVEIGNTFGELKYFYLGSDKIRKETFHDQHIKYYYISPFTDLDNVLDFYVQIPSDHLNITIDVSKDNKKFLFTSMTGKKLELTTVNLLWQTIKFPFVTIKVIFLIHWHAAVLHFSKKINHHPKEEHPTLQREVKREWSKK